MSMLLPAQKGKEKYVKMQHFQGDSFSVVYGLIWFSFRIQPNSN